MVADVWQQIPIHYTGINIDAFVVMPNHIHGIVIIKAGQSRGIAPTSRIRNVGADPCVCPRNKLSIPQVVQRYKEMTTKLYIDGVNQSGWQPFYGKLWQRNYYDHIIRNENDLYKIRQYILANPREWLTDSENSDNKI